MKMRNKKKPRYICTFTKSHIQQTKTTKAAKTDIKPSQGKHEPKSYILKGKTDKSKTRQPSDKQTAAADLILLQNK